MKKITSLLLAILCTLSLSACQKPEEIDKDSKKDAEAEVTKVVESYMDAICEMDYAQLNDFIVEENDEYDGLDAKEEMLEGMFGGEIPAELVAYEDDFDDICNNLIDVICEKMTYEIISVEEDGDNYVVTVEMTSMDWDELIAVMNDEEAMSEMGYELGVELAESGKINESMSEEELMKVILEETLILMEEIIEDFVSGSESITYEMEIVVEDHDGEWLINEEDSDIEGIEEITEKMFG